LILVCSHSEVEPPAAGSVGFVDGQPEAAAQEIVCPHCKHSFEPREPIGIGDERQGYKCPHCRLFVALERAEPV
jgi:DNA-directed RNA polymerase subunit RPC12/RpoP